MKPVRSRLRIRLNDEVLTVPVEKAGDALRFNLGGKVYSVRLLSEDRTETVVSGSLEQGPPSKRPAPRQKVPAPPAPPNAQPNGTTPVTAPVSGVVKQVLVEVGQPVAEGDQVLVLEAMKMEIQIGATSSGEVGQIFANAGDLVEENSTLLTIVDQPHESVTRDAP